MPDFSPDTWSKIGEALGYIIAGIGSVVVIIAGRFAFKAGTKSNENTYVSEESELRKSIANLAAEAREANRQIAHTMRDHGETLADIDKSVAVMRALMERHKD